MAHLHGQRQTRVQTRIRIPNPMATLYYPEHVYMAQTLTQIPTPYFCVGQESKFESVPESVSRSVIEPKEEIVFQRRHCFHGDPSYKLMSCLLC